MTLKIKLASYVVYKIMKILWNNISKKNIPDTSGVYAWYYQHVIGKKDIEILVNSINNTRDYDEKYKLVEDFLSKMIFHHYEEKPYDAVIKGALKQTYKGVLTPDKKFGKSLIDKLINNPESVYDISEKMCSISPNFMSPLYIGMAKNLFSRINQHQNSIERYKESISKDFLNDDSFATRVVSKGFRVSHLYVVYQETGDDKTLHNVLENILNRINYPILGKN